MYSFSSSKLFILFSFSLDFIFDIDCFEGFIIIIIIII